MALSVTSAFFRHISSQISGVIATFFPALAKAAPELTGFNNFKKDLQYSYNYLSKFTKSRLATYDGSSEENFSDIYMKEMKRTTDPTSSFYGQRGGKSRALVMTPKFTDFYLKYFFQSSL